MSGKRAKRLRKEIRSMFERHGLDMKHFRRAYRKAKKTYTLMGGAIYGKV